MAKRSKKNSGSHTGASSASLTDKTSLSKSSSLKWVSDIWLPLLLATITFLIYWPSLSSDLVYDARNEILEEGFITSLANLPAVLSLKVLGMNVILGSRPGQILYLMLIAAICGKEPFGYHLCSNLLHAANVALLFVLLRRLIAVEITGLTKSEAFKAQLAAVVVSLIFAVHPIVVETVASVSYSSDLLMTFFALASMLAATSFRPDKLRAPIVVGAFGTACALASVACKESGIAIPFLLFFYWWLFRRREARIPWACFLSAVAGVTTLFLAARFYFVTANNTAVTWLGGSFLGALLTQPRLWVFMLGKLVWTINLSADYTLHDIRGISTSVAVIVLVVVITLQVWLSTKSRLGALGVATFWLGLATVSNFTPLFRILGDRFYYLPLAGIAMQLLAVLLMTLKSPSRYWMAIIPGWVVLVPLSLLSLAREDVFASEASLWSNTLQVSPYSSLAHNGMGNSLVPTGHLDEAIVQYQKALEIDPDFAVAHYNLGFALFREGRLDDAIAHYQRALKIDHNYAEADNNLGNAFLQKGQLEDAIEHYEQALEIAPSYVDARNNLGWAFLQKGLIDQAIDQFEKALAINPNYALARNNLVEAQRMARVRATQK